MYPRSHGGVESVIVAVRCQGTELYHPKIFPIFEDIADFLFGQRLFISDLLDKDEAGVMVEIMPW